MEWILIVAAVGGLATIGVLVVRSASDSAGETTEPRRTSDAYESEVQDRLHYRDYDDAEVLRRCEQALTQWNSLDLPDFSPSTTSATTGTTNADGVDPPHYQCDAVPTDGATNTPPPRWTPPPFPTTTAPP